MDEAARVHPQSWWWVKADGCDLVSGLSESVRGQWNGAVDLNDNSLQQQFKAYQYELEFVKKIVGQGRTGIASITQDMELLKHKLTAKVQFVSDSEL